MVLGVPVRATVENQPGNKHVESLKIRRLDEGSNPSDSTILFKGSSNASFFLSVCRRGENPIKSATAIKKKRVKRSRFSLSFVTPKVEKSNFYKDLEGVMEYSIKRNEKQN
jgi:hypothetical protein